MTSEYEPKYIFLRRPRSTVYNFQRPAREDPDVLERELKKVQGANERIQAENKRLEASNKYLDAQLQAVRSELASLRISSDSEQTYRLRRELEKCASARDQYSLERKACGEREAKCNEGSKRLAGQLASRGAKITALNENLVDAMDKLRLCNANLDRAVMPLAFSTKRIYPLPPGPVGTAGRAAARKRIKPLEL